MTCYPKISDLINDVLGTNINLPIQSFGFFVALAFFVGAWILAREFRRKEKLGLLKPMKQTIKIGEGIKPADLIINAIVGFIIGYKIVPILSNYSDFADDPQTFIFAANGSIGAGIAMAALLAFLKYREVQKNKLDKPETKVVEVWPHDRIADIVTIAAIFGILGARLMVLIENGGWRDFLTNPGANFFSGLSIYGGLLLGGAAVILYARRKGISFFHLGDAAAPMLMVTYGIGRMGCQVSGDGDWGIINNAPKPNWLSWAPDWAWAYNYPNNVNQWCSPTGEWSEVCDFATNPYLTSPVFPTPFYEIILAGLIAGFLFWLSRRVSIAGVIFGAYLILNGVERLLIEQIRINTPYPNFFNLTQAEIVAGSFIILGIFLIVNQSRKAARDKTGDQRDKAADSPQ